MPNRNEHVVICCLLALIAVTLLTYGLCFNSEKVLPEDKEDSTVFIKPELALIRAVARGGLIRDKLGNLRFRSSESCPT
jgi:hypothetical protein